MTNSRLTWEKAGQDPMLVGLCRRVPKVEDVDDPHDRLRTKNWFYAKYGFWQGQEEWKKAGGPPSPFRVPEFYVVLMMIGMLSLSIVGWYVGHAIV